MPDPTKTTPASFWAKGIRTGKCLIWPGVAGARGYGRVHFEGKHWTPARLAWTLRYGPIKGGLYVCHTCDTPMCYEPLHLFLGTQADNLRDSVAKGRRRSRAGLMNPNGRLSDDDVREIRRLRTGGVPTKEVASRFGVTAAAIWEVTSGRNHRNVA